MTSPISLKISFPWIWALWGVFAGYWATALNNNFDAIITGSGGLPGWLLAMGVFIGISSVFVLAMLTVVAFSALAGRFNKQTGLQVLSWFVGVGLGNFLSKVIG